MQAKIIASIAVNTNIKKVLLSMTIVPFKISILISNTYNKIHKISEIKKNFWIEKNEFNKQKIEIIINR